MPSVQPEQLLAFGFLYECSYNEDGKMVLFYENETHSSWRITLYLLYKELTSLGYKITRILNDANDDGTLTITVYTNIPADVSENATRVYNAFVGEIYEE